jgi:hypothetical protein
VFSIKSFIGGFATGAITLVGIFVQSYHQELLEAFKNQTTSKPHIEAVGALYEASDGASTLRDDQFCKGKQNRCWFTFPSLDPISSIGEIVNPAPPIAGRFAMHDHQYVNGIPDPKLASVTYKFDTSATIGGIEILEHTNGITEIQAYAGENLNSIEPIGSKVTSEQPDVSRDNLFDEGKKYDFYFGRDALPKGKFLQVVILSTNKKSGWATYRIYPLTADHERIAPREDLSLVSRVCRAIRLH